MPTIAGRAGRGRQSRQAARPTPTQATCRGLLLRSLVLALALPAFAAAVQPETDIRVRVYDYVGVSPSTLAKMKEAASHVLERAGARVSWADCKIRAEDPAKDPACELTVTSRDLQVRIVGREMADRIGTDRQSLGYSWLTPDHSSVAAVYYHRAAEVAEGHRVPGAVVLGCTIAHEIGHLLLGDAGHSANGIMRASWDANELRLMAKGRLHFLPEQSQRLMLNITRRRNASLAGVVAAPDDEVRRAFTTETACPAPASVPLSDTSPEAPTGWCAGSTALVLRFR